MYNKRNFFINNELLFMECFRFKMLWKRKKDKNIYVYMI